MVVTFHALASGSAGNAALVDVGGFGVLLDFGLRPRLIGQRLRACGSSWARVRAALLTHTHGDHWQPHTLAELLKRDIPLWCHAEHVEQLARAGDSFTQMRARGLVRFYTVDDAWELPSGFHCRAVPVQHDAAMTCAFRFDGSPGMFGAAWALGYLADLGCWDVALAETFRDVDLLALEFNHDTSLQRRSGRPYYLIRRVLGNSGHLSNDQAVGLLRAVLKQSEPGRLRHLVQLHLSRECNRPEIAQLAAELLRDEVGAGYAIHTAAQDVAGPSLSLQAPSVARRRFVRPPGSARERYVQPHLPGWE